MLAVERAYCKLKACFDVIALYLKGRDLEYSFIISRLDDIYDHVVNLKENEFLHVIHENNGTLIGKVGGKWIAEPIVCHAQGGFTKVELTNSVALRILSGSEDRQRLFLKKEKIVSERINKNGSAIGIIPPPIGFVKKIYDVKNRITSEYPLDYSVNIRFTGDLSTSNFSVKESLKICAHVALGVKALHEAHLHHLDIKPQNILYGGNGVAYLADFDWMVKSDLFDFFLPKTAYTLAYTQEKDIINLESAWVFSEAASQMDIFALGATFYQIGLKAQGIDDHYPYFIVNKYAGNLKPTNELVNCMIGVYKKEQIEMIFKMLCTDPYKRPSIQEVVKAFPMQP